MGGWDERMDGWIGRVSMLLWMYRISVRRKKCIDDMTYPFALLLVALLLVEDIKDLFNEFALQYPPWTIITNQMMPCSA